MFVIAESSPINFGANYFQSLHQQSYLQVLLWLGSGEKSRHTVLRRYYPAVSAAIHSAVMQYGWRFPDLQLSIAAAILLTAAALRIADPVPVAALRASVFDSYLRAAPRVADPDFPVRIVAIDEPSLKAIGQWPWPRTILADLVGKLSAAGAKVIAFDIVMAEVDRLSPEKLAQGLSEFDSLQPMLAEIARRPSNDARLAAAIAAAPAVVAIVGDGQGETRVGKARASLSFAGDDPARFVHSFAGGVETLGQLTAGARGVGAVNWLPEQDQIVRRAPLLAKISGELYPSLALEALRVAEAQTSVFVKSSGASGLSALGQQTGIESLRVGQSIAPTDGHGELWLKFAPADPRRTLSAASILAGDFDANDIRGRYVFIGATAAGLLDLRATPLSASVPGVEIHAQTLEQLLAADNLVRPAYATGSEILFLLLSGVLVTWLMLRSDAKLAAIVSAGAIASVVALSWIAYRRAGFLFDPVYPAASLALLYLGTSLTTYVHSEAERAKIRSAFSHYVSPPLVAELVRNHDKLKLGGETRVITLLFADVRGFSRLSEGLAAEDLIRFVNRLFTPLTETILDHGGTIDKFMGDAVMAFWNAPADDPDHARNACRAALAMLDDLSRLNASLAAESAGAGRPFDPIRIGVGLNTGACVVGNVGSPERFDYSVLGDVVNVAARFEESTKTYGADIIIGEATAQAAADFAFLDVGFVMLRGKDRQERIFALSGDSTMAATREFAELRREHSILMAAIDCGNSNAAIKSLAACRDRAPPAAMSLYRAIEQKLDRLCRGDAKL